MRPTWAKSSSKVAFRFGYIAASSDCIMSFSAWQKPTANSTANTVECTCSGAVRAVVSVMCEKLPALRHRRNVPREHEGPALFRDGESQTFGFTGSLKGTSG